MSEPRDGRDGARGKRLPARKEEKKTPEVCGVRCPQDSRWTEARVIPSSKGRKRGSEGSPTTVDGRRKNERKG